MNGGARARTMMNREQPRHGPLQVSLGDWATTVINSVTSQQRTQFCITAGNVLVQWFARPLVSRRRARHLLREFAA